ncbi:5-methyltetrahydropteroyltriglutamate--homocysteine S-methyltransferase [Cellvibrio japonicus]|uniref:5-methyltetrahydropteroyltriglutamate--homocysteine methyltransferase n=1 Tax=Cellvibrio japonicus (strain Ueda107) TaxID=498211 RepID=B3PKI0_CELJU|nr:5-methyltetrahydropteroyltriglutamate--homocysteine S-methyltransferase [Cellvibrio japonicus]ACE83506.1 5-methyltetrahydropteroyltriglutamate--homocysteine S-methyltransferase [Cellvibrio japonicus Ueda107]QEI12846.1 5-methyltetrahydropteroyltriglutamate--homocysteine S-methyltransferase [Cellvibrio japonicus]QEI16420.1 5-methyltetrahydropteroyltriglutamate--homocysteine S-methyltransferase [Cellvibrio japonicus]QEI19998.1 5-methyltetrahydropteroyltriglutamate--homocysteine S-methyltransfer
MNQTLTTHNLGFPRIGADRELKKALEAYWRGDITQAQLEQTGRKLRQTHWQWQADAGLSLIPTGDFAWYDQVLTLSATLGNIPLRHRSLSHHKGTADHGHSHQESGCCNHTGTEVSEFASEPCQDIDLDTLFRVARGRAPSGQATTASDMTKWFDTNYHYLVPEFHAGQQFQLSWTQIIDDTREAIALGYKAKPVILGPLSYLWLGREKHSGFDRLDLLDSLIPAYQQLLTALADTGATWVQIDEPILVLDLPGPWQRAFEEAYNRLQQRQLNILLATYFGALGDNLTTAINLPVAGLHIDAVRAPEQLLPVIDRLPAHKILSVGVVDGRNIWRNDLAKSLSLLKPAQERLGQRLWIAPSCSLLHSPVNLERETQLPADLKSWLAFARQKLDEVAVLETLLSRPFDSIAQQALAHSNAIAECRAQSPKTHNPEVRARLNAITEALWNRQSPFAQRIAKQQALLQLPLFPTTTIGSFPQTDDIRKTRSEFKQGQINSAEYENRIRQEIADCIAKQEAIGLDVLVHGEAERNDMVEYFGEQLDGYTFTQHGWVQSYGSRCVKPPIIYGDVARPAPITLSWARYAQSLSNKPVKGMLTGPITMLFWSFVRDDQPRSTTALQIALALRDEVVDLEAAGIQVIQIDEPAIREGLPLRDKDRRAYLDWAVKAFRITASGVQDETQIHTHMCYSEFNDIIQAIAALDADVITIETSRSDGELLQAFEQFNYPNDIGPGVYDIHSPNVPDVNSMVQLIKRAARQLPTERLWVNPDCGLKTRRWPETEAALVNMVKAARELREEFVREQERDRVIAAN